MRNMIINNYENPNDYFNSDFANLNNNYFLIILMYNIKPQTTGATPVLQNYDNSSKEETQNKIIPLTPSATSPLESIINKEEVKKKSLQGETTDLYFTDGTIRVWNAEAYDEYLTRAGKKEYGSREEFTWDYLRIKNSKDFQGLKQYLKREQHLQTEYLDNILLGEEENPKEDYNAAQSDLMIRTKQGVKKQPIIMIDKEYSKKVKEMARTAYVSEEAVKNYLMWHEMIHATQETGLKENECLSELDVDRIIIDYVNEAINTNPEVNNELYEEISHLAKLHGLQYEMKCEPRSLDEIAGLYKAT